MDFAFTPDQALLAETLDKWSAGHREIAHDDRSRAWLDGGPLAADLRAQGFYDAAAVPELGALGAVLLIEAAGRTPYAIETGASGLIAPLLGIEDVPHPCALLVAGRRPVGRFLRLDCGAIVDSGDHIRLLSCGDRVEPVESPYAYPMGRYTGDVVADSQAVEGAEIGRFRQLRALAVSAEALAAMDAALALTVGHVTARVQFKRPLGSFQALQHRLAECAAVIEGLRLLVYRAAVEGGTHAYDAAIVAHDAAKRLIYETSQFHGALGLTLEYPLHLWVYRLRALQMELAQAAAEAVA